MSAIPITRDDVLARLAETKVDLATTFGALSDAQWTWAPDDIVWSAANLAEHIGAVEYSMARLFRERFETLEAADFTAEQHAKRDALIRRAVPDRSAKIEAPAGVRPKNRFATRAECMAALMAAHDAMVDVVRTRGETLRTRSAPHPAFGNLDGLQWGLLCAEHGARHLAQLAELRTLPGFPSA